jgi:DNA-binding MarR family transcriptional regulator
MNMSLTASADALSPAAYRSLAEFRYQIRRFLHFSEQAARAEGLEPQQHQMLLAIRAWNRDDPEDHGPAIGQLAESMFIRHHSAVGLVDRMEEQGLAERIRGRHDRREVRVRLTPRGAKVLERLASAHHAELKNSGPQLVQALTVVLEGKPA